MPSRPTHTWSQVKLHIRDLEKEELILLVRDLHALNTENKRYLAARFQTATPDEIAAPFRAQIEAALNSDPRNFRLDLPDARRALNSYKRFTDDPLLIIQMMLHLVGQGLSCVTNNSGVADRTIIGLCNTYRDAAALSKDIDDPKTIDELRILFASLVREAEEADWWLYESMMDIYVNFLPQEEVEE